MAAQLQHHHLVGNVGHHAEVVRDEQHRRAVLGCSSRMSEDLGLRGHVQRGGGLVADQQRGLQDERHGDHDALALPARELVRVGA
jgi:hypothetical protein